MMTKIGDVKVSKDYYLIKLFRETKNKSQDI